MCGSRSLFSDVTVTSCPHACVAQWDYNAFSYEALGSLVNMHCLFRPVVQEVFSLSNFAGTIHAGKRLDKAWDTIHM